MENWQTIITLTQPHEAHLAKGVLESEGIETIIHDDVTAQVNNFYSNAIDGVKVLIKESDIQKGLVILKQGGYINEPKDNAKLKIETYFIKSQEEKKTCPYCTSENFSKARHPNIVSIIGVFLFYAFLPIFKTHYHCFDCDKRWRFKIKN
jgi:DNA-directed RNA polymerase subunit RPC12/RpoP